VVGANVRRLREVEGVTQAELVEKCERMGLHWARSKLSALEAGRRPTTGLGELLTFAMALHAPVSEMFAGEGKVIITPTSFEIARRGVEALLSAEPSPIDSSTSSPWAFPAGSSSKGDLEASEGDLEARAKDLRGRLARLIEVLDSTEDVVRRQIEDQYGHDLTTERDRRVEEMGPMSLRERRARRGHVTRQLVGELREALEESSHS
jgi:transcriptional regulator with XRE-family HTH domain